MKNKSTPGQPPTTKGKGVRKQLKLPPTWTDKTSRIAALLKISREGTFPRGLSRRLVIAAARKFCLDAEELSMDTLLILRYSADSFHQAISYNLYNIDSVKSLR